MLHRRTLRTASFLLALAFAGCGGGGGHSVLPAASTAADAQRTTQAVNAITPVVYVSGQGSVYAYPLTATNSDPPAKVLGSEYVAADGTAIGGIATDRKGTLYVLVNDGSLTAGGPSCKILQYDASAVTGTTPQLAYRCAPDVFYATGIASGPNGEIDVLDTIDNMGQTGFQVERFFPGSSTYATSRLKLQAQKPYSALGAGANGNIFVGYDAVGANSAHVDKYAALATGSTAPTQGVDVAGYTNLHSISSGRGYVWIMAGSTSGAFAGVLAMMQTTPMLATPLQAGGNGGYPATRFSASAVDTSGNLYVGETYPTGTTDIAIPVSGGSPNFGASTYLYDPVRRGNPAGAIVTGVAIAQ
jgi:hypothetical protein